MKKCLLLFIGALLCTIGVYAQTNLSSYFETNTTLTVANSPYIVTNYIEVNPGVTVTVEEGVEIRFNSGVALRVYGTLNAKGTKFTANGSTDKGFWDGIYLSYEWSNEIGNVTLDNCTVEYARNIYTSNGQLTLKNSTNINNFSEYGVQIYTKGTLNIENTTIKNTIYPIMFNGPGELKAGNNGLLTGNTNDYILLNFTNIPGTFNMPNLGIPYYCSGLTVANTGNLIISPGVEIKFSYSELTINGKIKALGTIEKPIVFDKYPTSSEWYGINLKASSIDTACIFRYCTFKNSYPNDYDQYSAMEIISSSPTFENCKFTANGRNLMVTGISKPTFTNCTFYPSTVLNGECYNIGMDMNANVDFTTDSIKFNNTEIRAIKISASNVIDDAQLKKLSFKNLDNPTYCLYGTTTVNDTASLLIDPGIVIKCRDTGARITANGTLTGIGTATEPIVFTSIADDNFGNPRDSQNDNVQTIGHGNSGRIAILSKTTSKIENWKIHYGGYYSSYWAVEVSNGNIVKNCEIKNSYKGVYFSDNAQVLNNTFLNIDNYAVGRTVNQGNPVLIGNTISNIGKIGILIGAFGNDSPTLKSMDFAGFTNVAYFVENMQTIAEGNIVTIDPGVVIKFQDNNAGLIVNGALKAIGKANKKIIFTSLNDDSAAGDSNNNGTATTPGNADWGGIEYTGSASDTENILKNTEIRYCGYNYYYNPVKGAIRMTDCRVAMDSVKVNFSSTYALGIYGNANPVISNSQFYNLGNAPVYMDMFSNPTFSEIKIANTPRIGLALRGQEVKGTVPVRSFAGYDTITYILDDNLTVTDQLTIPAGLTFKGAGSWQIRGKLDIQGTVEKPVVFTTQEDDFYGKPKDMQQNGTTAMSNGGNYFVFYDESNDLSTINHALFRYSASNPIQLTNASPKITNTKFENIAFPGISLAGSSAPSINGCTFNNTTFPFTTSLVTYPAETTGNIISGTTGRAIRVSDETLTQDATLIKRNFAGITNIPYVFQNYTVGTGAILNIKPGIVCKFLQNGYLNIQNGLIAKGGSTTDSTIVFTADKDDFYGGDTYSDGDANLPTTYHWRGINFYNESIDENCILENCIFKNASDYYYNPNYTGYDPYRYAAITLDNASPTIKNCLFESNYYGIISRNTSLPKISNCDFVVTDPTYGYGVWNQTATNTITATDCWWNSNTGPRHASNPGGLGERVSDGVNFDPWAMQLAKPVLGDVSMNGEIKPYDASLILQYTVGTTTLTDKQLSVADVSGNGIISAYDASMILEYSVDLITRFDPDPLGTKSATLNDLATISFPDLISEPTKKTFEIPLTVSTAQGIKALDMKYLINQDHVKFIGLNIDNLSSDISLEFGFNNKMGQIAISMASPYDLNFINQEFVLEFEFIESGITESQFSLTNAMANDSFLPDIPINATISSKSAITGADYQSRKTEPIVYTDQYAIHAKYELSKSNQDLFIQIVDLSGRILYKRTLKNISSGLQYFDLLYTDFDKPNNGIYILNLRADDFSYSKKLLIK